jgi:predicted dehydrogenase
VSNLDPIRLGMIGVGRRANYHLRNLSVLPDVQITALCDPQIERTYELKSNYRPLSEARCYEQHADLLEQEDLDGVVIGTPHATHFPIARASLRRGCHVLLEKPVACTAAEARHLQEDVARFDRLLLVAYQRRYESAYRYVREAIAAGLLGDLVAVNGFQTQAWKTRMQGNWRHQPELSGGGQILDSGSHLLDVMLWASQLRAQSVYSVIDDVGMSVDIRSSLLIEMESGVQATLAIVGDGAGWCECVTFMGTEATLTYRDGKLLLISPESEPMTAGPLPPASNPDENFIQAIRQRAPIACDVEDGLRVLELIEAARQSAEIRRVVCLPR